MKQPPRCPWCKVILDPPAPRPDGLEGIRYYTCHGCGWSQAITTPTKKASV